MQGERINKQDCDMGRMYKKAGVAATQMLVVQLVTMGVFKALSKPLGGVIKKGAKVVETGEKVAKETVEEVAGESAEKIVDEAVEKSVGDGIKYSPINLCDEISREVAETFEGVAAPQNIYDSLGNVIGKFPEEEIKFLFRI